jgi:hypothetical protein
LITWPDPDPVKSRLWVGSPSTVIAVVASKAPTFTCEVPVKVTPALFRM